MDRVKALAQNRLAEVEAMVRCSSQAIDADNILDEDENEEMKVFRQRLDEIRYIRERAQSLLDLFNSLHLGNTRNTNGKTNSKKEVLENILGR